MQATDYAYTLQGWMKYINGPILHPEADMGNDGTDKNPTNFYFGRDVMAFGINYYGGDYKPIQNIPGNQFTNNFQLNSLPTGQPLYNGNISATLLALKGLNNNTTTGYTYLYDQLNRLLNTRQHAFGAASGSYKGNWSQSNTGTTDNYAETFRYDANGNILQLNRNGNSQHPGGLAMDRLNYTYRDGTNQLWSVQDGIAAGAYAGDIDNQGGSNYSYDRIGNLIGDVSENISQVNWTVYGKIGNIQKKQAFLGYVYNAGGERVVKQYLPYATNQCLGCDENTGMVDLEVYERNSNTPNIYKASKTITFLSEYTDVRYNEYTAIIEAGLALCTPQCNVQPPLTTSDADIYIRDATGNTLAVYHYDRKTSQLRWSEQHLYGSARLGMYLPEKLLTSVSTESKQREVGYLGKQVFELSNHLGNILATITDKKLQVSTNTTSTAYFEADVQTVQDYYAFGMQMPGRKLSGGYRYGFNGKENDNEVKGEGNEINFGGRVYDSRLGKFLSIDPMARSYPGESHYIFAGNSPLQFTDYNGYFKISPFFAQRYPTLARIIESYLPLLKDNRLAKEGWIKTVGFSNHAEGEKAFDDMVTYGQGLWITPTRPGNEQREGIRQDLSGFFEPTGNAGEWQGPKGYPENVTIGYSFLDDLETAMKKGNANDIGKQMFVVSVLIMHEASHWGKWKYNCCEVDGDYRYEAGANFEYNTFGTRFSYQNADKKYFDDDKLKGFYNQEKGGYNSSSFGFSINQSSTYWNRIKNSALSGGQKGDPSLKENGDKEPNPKVFLPKDTYRTGNGETSGQNSYNY